jgi:hypothetical protein
MLVGGDDEGELPPALRRDVRDHRGHRLGVALRMDAAVEQDVLCPVVGGNGHEEAVTESDVIHPDLQFSVARHSQYPR